MVRCKWAVLFAGVSLLAFCQEASAQGLAFNNGVSSAWGWSSGWIGWCWHHGGEPPQWDEWENDHQGLISTVAGGVNLLNCCYAVNANVNSTGGVLPTQVYASAFYLASAAGDAGYDGPMTSVSSNGNYTVTGPPGGLGPGEVLVLYGTYTVNTAGDAMSFSSASGPGVDVTAGMGMGVFGTVVDVLNGTTTNLELWGATGHGGTYSVIVTPGQQITLFGSGDCMGPGGYGTPSTGTATMALGGAVKVVDESTIPPMQGGGGGGPGP